MDFSADVISKGRGSAPVKLGYSSFYREVQIKQRVPGQTKPPSQLFSTVCVARQNTQRGRSRQSLPRSGNGRSVRLTNRHNQHTVKVLPKDFTPPPTVFLPCRRCCYNIPPSMENSPHLPYRSPPQKETAKHNSVSFTSNSSTSNLVPYWKHSGLLLVRPFDL